MQCAADQRDNSGIGCGSVQAQVDENLKKQAELMAVIDRETAAYKHAFGYTEWRSACEVRFNLRTSHLL